MKVGETWKKISPQYTIWKGFTTLGTFRIPDEIVITSFSEDRVTFTSESFTFAGESLSQSIPKTNFLEIFERLYDESR